MTKDSKNEIKVIKEGNLFYIVEFVRIRHELFFSGDGKRAFFQEWGKGPPGNAGLRLGEDGNSILVFGISDTAKWALSYTMYRKP